MVNKIEADLGSDLLLRYALTRRGLALDQANLLRFRLHDSWVERLMEVRHTAPPPGYSPVTHQQILSADRKLFVKVAEATREGVQLQATGRPIDLIWDNMCNHPDVAHLLQPLPSPAPSRPDNPYRPHPYGGGGKGKTKGGKGNGLNCLPQALRDHGTAVTTQGHALCFGYSLKRMAGVRRGCIFVVSRVASGITLILIVQSLKMPDLLSDYLPLQQNKSLTNVNLKCKVMGLWSPLVTRQTPRKPWPHLLLLK